MSARRPLPRWADVALLPLLNLGLAMIVSGFVVAAIGQSPLQAIQVMIKGAFGDGVGIGFTLYYATDFIFTGLAVAVAAHAGLFNIGGDGQAYVAGIGALAAGMLLGNTHWLLVLPVATLFAAAVGAAWVFIPAYLQAKRGSHVVITTIMFNFIGSALMIYLLNGPLKGKGTQGAESAAVTGAGLMPHLQAFVPAFGYAPVNVSLFVALLALVACYVLVWHTRFGYAMRAMGHNAAATRYAGISNSKMIITILLISGGFAGITAVNEVLGSQTRLVTDITGQAGFIGIAVALMGRNHPVGILLAAVLFGALTQGGTELQFDMPAVSVQMILVIQALVIMFTGAMEGLLRPGLENVFMIFGPRQRETAVSRETATTES
ncbi:MAG TPA: ABC transporter permease [Stellaceae bacterium]|jgi:simple sugar transport system permease protein|nr:ABC transporter permease [Stellaceae bacterium]